MINSTKPFDQYSGMLWTRSYIRTACTWISVKCTFGIGSGPGPGAIDLSQIHAEVHSMIDHISVFSLDTFGHLIAWLPAD